MPVRKAKSQCQDEGYPEWIVGIRKLARYRLLLPGRPAFTNEPRRGTAATSLWSKDAQAEVQGRHGLLAELRAVIFPQAFTVCRRSALSLGFDHRH